MILLHLTLLLTLLCTAWGNTLSSDPQIRALPVSAFLILLEQPTFHAIPDLARKCSGLGTTRDGCNPAGEPGRTKGPFNFTQRFHLVVCTQCDIWELWGANKDAREIKQFRDLLNLGTKCREPQVSEPQKKAQLAIFNGKSNQDSHRFSSPAVQALNTNMLLTEVQFY